MKLQSQQSLETPPSTLKILSVTWNLCGSIPPQKYLQQFFTSQQFALQPELIFIGTQECELSLFWAFFWDSKPKWQSLLKKHLPKYHLLATNTLQGLHSAILILNNHKDQANITSSSVLRAGFCCNLFGNKGATQIKIKIYGQYFQFINCHLAPHQDNNQHRNETLIKIIQKMACVNQSTQVILLGDMNYRLEIKNKDYKKFTKDQPTNTETKVHYQSMLHIQQLRNQQVLKQRFLPFYQEGEIDFPPTYKMNIQSDQYNRSRVPGWTDRIFCRKGKIRKLNYECMYRIYGSDHRPVVSMFEIDMEEGLSLFEDETFTESQCLLI